MLTTFHVSYVGVAASLRPYRLEGRGFRGGPWLYRTLVCWAHRAVDAVAARLADARVAINEIHCNPDDETEQVEFVELHNAGATDVDLSGWYFDAGLTYRFAPGATLPAEGYLVVAENPEQIHAKWSAGRFSIDGDLVLGPYEGRLDNEGERVALCNTAGQLVDEVDYRIGFPWPTVGSPVPRGTVGTGASIQLIHSEADNDVAGNWRSAPPSPVAPNSAVYVNNLPPYEQMTSYTPSPKRKPRSSGEILMSSLGKNRPFK